MLRRQLLAARIATVCLLVALMAAPQVVGATSVSAQSALTIILTEDPFVCDGGTRELGQVSGFAPNEPVQFSSPKLNGVFSERLAEASGAITMRWTCDAADTWNVTVTGVASGKTATFVVTGAVAPPPPEPPPGAAFDAKSAMTAQHMAVWKQFSPYGTAGIYIPVNSEWDMRADKEQVNLTPAWVAEVLAGGWRLLPIYVGRQAPASCAIGSFENVSDDPTVARDQGIESAADAVASASALGLGAGSPIYYDMEAYRPGCSEPVIAFLDGWTEGLHAAGYLSGVYGSRTSTMTDMSQSVGRGGFDPPDAVWVSTNSRVETTLGLEMPPDNLWTNARIHQYRLGVTRTYGGITLEVDDNIIDAPAASYVPPIIDTDGDGVGEPEPDNCDRFANPDQSDLDNDGDGDVCDVDIDGDGVNNDVDIAPTDPAVWAAPTAIPTAIPPTPIPPPATPVPATPVPATPVPATPIPATPVPATPIPATVTPVPAPTLVPTIAPTVAVPTATVTPDIDAIADGTAAGSANESELATDAVVIRDEDNGANVRWLGVAAAAMAAVGFMAMAARSWRASKFD